MLEIDNKTSKLCHNPENFRTFFCAALDLEGRPIAYLCRSISPAKRNFGW